MEEIVYGAHYADSYNGAGTGLTAIPRTGLAAGTANHVLVNDGTGVLSSVALLNTARGGTGLDTSASTGVAKISSGTWSAAEVTNADVAAAAAIARTKLASGSANYVLVNNGSGVASEEAQLATSRGGTGQNFGIIGAGPFIVTAASGAMAATLQYATAATPSTVVQRDGSGGITAGQLSATSLSTPTITAVGDITINPAGGDVFFGTNIVHMTPTAIPGGDAVIYVGNAQTIGAVNATAITIPIATDTSAGIVVSVTAGDVTGGIAAGHWVFNTRAKNLSGTVTLGTILQKSQSRDAPLATGDVTAVVSGLNIIIRVVGVVGITVNWMGRAEVVTQTY